MTMSSAARAGAARARARRRIQRVMARLSLGVAKVPFVPPCLFPLLVLVEPLLPLARWPSSPCLGLVASCGGGDVGTQPHRSGWWITSSGRCNAVLRSLVVRRYLILLFL